MGFYLLPLIVCIFFLSLVQIKEHQVQQSTPAASATEAVWCGQEFVAYRDAVMIYHQQNPGVTGSLPHDDQLSTRFSPRFLAVAGNQIVTDGTRVGVVCWASLPRGAFSAALAASQNDIAIGTATTATTWTSAAPGAVARNLPAGVAVPVGSVVSYFQTGN